MCLCLHCSILLWSIFLQKVKNSLIKKKKAEYLIKVGIYFEFLKIFKKDFLLPVSGSALQRTDMGIHIIIAKPKNFSGRQSRTRKFKLENS